MKCPRTGTEMKAVKVGGIEVDISEECGGVFFDHYELEKFDDSTDIRGEVLIEHLKQFPPPLLDDSQTIHCPRCPQVKMRRFHYSEQAQLEIDECINCGGIWLDAGELERLRDLFPSPEDRQKAARDIALGYRGEEGGSAGEARENKGGKFATLLWRLLGQ
jgi:Zn-finger nucleic acid-binding protein